MNKNSTQGRPKSQAASKTSAPRDIAIGAQGFPELRERGCFLVDKTAFIREWWKANELEERGLPRERIHCYGLAFEGKHVLIGGE